MTDDVPGFLQEHVGRPCIKDILTGDPEIVDQETLISALQMVDRLALRYALKGENRIYVTREGIGKYRASHSVGDSLKVHDVLVDASLTEFHVGSNVPDLVDVLDTPLSDYHDESTLDQQSTEKKT